MTFKTSAGILDEFKASSDGLLMEIAGVGVNDDVVVVAIATTV